MPLSLRPAILLRVLCRTLVVLACAGTDVEARRTLPSEYFGVNAQFLFPTMPQSTWSRHLDAMAASGVKVVRYDATWNDIERYPPLAGSHNYYWDYYDAVVAELAKRRLRWYPIVGYSAEWSSSTPGMTNAPPASSEDFADFARVVAARYGRNGSFWAARPELPRRPVKSYEIWNEPNGPDFWKPEPDPARYVDLYLAARTAIQSADPKADVVVGGLSLHDVHSYLRAMIDHRPEARREIDAIGYHPYDPNVHGSIQWLIDLRRTATEIGMGSVPIEVTEVGWPTQGGDATVPDPERASRYSRLTELVARSDCGVRRFIPHTWITPEEDPANREHWFGINHPDGRPSPSRRAYAQAIRRLTRSNRSKPLRRLSLCGRGGVLRR